MGARLLNIQARAAEHGRLRTGYTQGKRPMRSATWVVTSHSEEHVRAAAGLWGGEPEQWSPLNSTITQWRVITKASSIEALITPGDPLNQYNEMWSAGGCQRRCDGETELLTRKACLCAARFGEDWHQQKKGVVCSTTSRLNVMLPDLSGMGMWRAETHSFYAASEWGVTLRIEPRQVIREGQTKKFPVVVVELRGVTPRQALAGPMNAATALDPGSAGRTVAAIEGPKGRDWIAEAVGALNSDDVRDLWMEAQQAGDVHPKGTDPLSKRLMAIAAEKDEENKKPAGGDEPGPDEEGVYVAEVVDDGPREAAGWPAAATPGSGARR
jgi:hypothetical protein